MTPTTYTVEWILDLLIGQDVLSESARREVEVRLPAQRARIASQHAEDFGGSSAAALARYSIGPGELVASFALQTADGQTIDEDLIAALVARAAKMPYRKIDPLELDMDLVSRTLSRPFAIRHVVLPLNIDDRALVVAVENPFDLEVVEGLKRLVRLDVKRVVAAKRDIIKAITEIYGFRKSVESAARERSADSLGDFEQLVRLRSVSEIEANDQHIVNAVDFMLRYAFDQRASDIHVEPRKNETQVRLRIDGTLHSTHTIPKQVQPAFASRLKTLARMDIAEKRRPQDGRIKTVLGDREVELRVSSLPVTFGEKMVIRIFDPEALLKDLPDVGFDAEELAVFERWIANPHGLILITGPTGSGKTTTLYAALKTLADETVNVTTVEDPIEMVTDRFNQTAVQSRIGVDFAHAMRAILRQDPDIIMVGEIRDRETAEMAVQAALTGHLVFSTLHTNDSVGAVTRLGDLGVPPFLISSTVVGVMAQRLIRRGCADCLEPMPLTLDQGVALGIRDMQTYANTVKGRGCPTCRGTGYFGRTGIFEMLDANEEIRLLIAKTAGEDRLRQAALAAGMRSLRDCALLKLANGISTAEETLATVGPVRIDG